VKRIFFKHIFLSTFFWIIFICQVPLPGNKAFSWKVGVPEESLESLREEAGNENKFNRHDLYRILKDFHASWQLMPSFLSPNDLDTRPFAPFLIYSIFQLIFLNITVFLSSKYFAFIANIPPPRPHFSFV
jgi:hypothetical protein